MKACDLGNGLEVAECEAGVVIADAMMTPEMQQVVLSNDQAGKLMVWLINWYKAEIRKRRAGKESLAVEDLQISERHFIKVNGRGVTMKVTDVGGRTQYFDMTRVEALALYKWLDLYLYQPGTIMDPHKE